MRVIMDYMYKDHLDATPFCHPPYALGSESSAISPVVTNQKHKSAEKDEQRKERK